MAAAPAGQPTQPVVAVSKSADEGRAEGCFMLDLLLFRDCWMQLSFLNRQHLMAGLPHAIDNFRQSLYSAA